MAAARIEVRAFRVVMIPALAIETVCCSCPSVLVTIGKESRVKQIEAAMKRQVVLDGGECKESNVEVVGEGANGRTYHDLM